MYVNKYLKMIKKENCNGLLCRKHVNGLFNSMQGCANRRSPALMEIL